jgi:hypothetical protein
MNRLLQREIAEAGLRLRKAISRVMNEAPECFTHENNKWSFEFRNPLSGESISVTYAGPTIPEKPLHQN